MHLKPAVAGKSHLQKRCNQAPVTPVGSGADKALPDQFLHDVKGAPEKARVVKVGGLITKLTIYVGQ